MEARGDKMKTRTSTLEMSRCALQINSYRLSWNIEYITSFTTDEITPWPINNDTTKECCGVFYGSHYSGRDAKRCCWLVVRIRHLNLWTGLSVWMRDMEDSARVHFDRSTCSTDSFFHIATRSPWINLKSLVYVWLQTERPSPGTQRIDRIFCRIIELQFGWTGTFRLGLCENVESSRGSRDHCLLVGTSWRICLRTQMCNKWLPRRVFENERYRIRCRERVTGTHPIVVCSVMREKGCVIRQEPEKNTQQGDLLSVIFFCAWCFIPQQVGITGRC